MFLLILYLHWELHIHEHSALNIHLGLFFVCNTFIQVKIWGEIYTRGVLRVDQNSKTLRLILRLITVFKKKSISFNGTSSASIIMESSSWVYMSQKTTPCFSRNIFSNYVLFISTCDVCFFFFFICFFKNWWTLIYLFATLLSIFIIFHFQKFIS